MTQASPPRIEVRDLSKAFEGKTVLEGVDLSVPRGQSLVVIGGSGTGKSVLLKCILGILHPDSGEVLFDGAPLDRRRRTGFLRRFGMLFQGAALFDSLPVWRNVAFRFEHGDMRLSRPEARARAIDKLRRVGLGPETADLYPSELSGGMQKRVGLARAIATDPEVIFFDEPTTGLDPIMSGVINELIREIVTEMGATAVTITHDMRTVETIADSVAMLHDGTLRWSGPASGIASSDNPYLRQFVAGSADGPIMTLR